MSDCARSERMLVDAFLRMHRGVQLHRIAFMGSTWFANINTTPVDRRNEQRPHPKSDLPFTIGSIQLPHFEVALRAMARSSGQFMAMYVPACANTTTADQNGI